MLDKDNVYVVDPAWCECGMSRVSCYTRWYGCFMENNKENECDIEGCKKKRCTNIPKCYDYHMEEAKTKSAPSQGVQRSATTRGIA